jgi:hypothetical protein
LQSIQHRLAGGQRRLLTRLRAPPVVGCCGICARPATAFVRACAGRCHGLFASVRRGDDCARGAVRGLIGIASCPHHRRLGRLVPHKPPGSPNRTDPGARDKREAPAGTRLFECQLVEGKYEHPCGLSRRHRQMQTPRTCMVRTTEIPVIGARPVRFTNRKCEAH